MASLAQYRNKERQTNEHPHESNENTNLRASKADVRISSCLRVCWVAVGSRATLLAFFFFSHIVEALWLNELFFNEAALCPRRRCSSPVVLRENLANACLAHRHGTFSLLLATPPPPHAEASAFHVASSSP